MEEIENAITDAIGALQREVTELSKITLQNRMALDMMLASHGGVCAVVNTSCCTYIDETGRINTDMSIIKHQIGILHEVQKDDTSLGFEEIWSKLTSWLPDCGMWLKQLFALILGIVIMIIVTCLTIQCCDCCARCNRHL